jgi:hypothetical protein
MKITLHFDDTETPKDQEKNQRQLVLFLDAMWREHHPHCSLYNQAYLYPVPLWAKVLGAVGVIVFCVVAVHAVVC